MASIVKTSIAFWKRYLSFYGIFSMREDILIALSMNVQRLFLLIALFIVAPVTLAAQSILPLNREQEQIPHSTGDTVPWYFDLTNLTYDTIEVQFFMPPDGYESKFVAFKDTVGLYSDTSFTLRLNGRAYMFF